MSFARAWCVVVAVSVGLVGVAGPAGAVPLQQPDGTPIPAPLGCASGQPTGLAAELACACTTPGTCNVGPPCAGPGACPVPQGTCETTLSHEPNDNTCIPSRRTGLDPWRDGALTPETFTPTCGLTFQLLSRGTARFRNTFGWYNVTGQPPAPTELYPMLGCDAAEGSAVVLDLRNDPRWAGGEIGFFLATPEQHGASGVCAGGDCCARVDRLPTVGRVYYSQRARNPDNVGAGSIIHLIVYDSAIADGKFYFAWEDTFAAANNDFTDLVTSVSGIECAGGGTACDTGRPGMCQYGVARCRGSAIECDQVYDAATEVCDGADNDCDGEIDEAIGCENLVGECATVTCAAGLICRQGQCFDPCVGVTCAAGLACLSGVCLPGCNQCGGVVCPAAQRCDLGSGACLGGGAEVDAGVDDDGSGGVAGTGGCCQAGGGPPLSAGAGFALVVLGLALGRRSRSRAGRADRSSR